MSKLGEPLLGKSSSISSLGLGRSRSPNADADATESQAVYWSNPIELMDFRSAQDAAAKYLGREPKHHDIILTVKGEQIMWGQLRMMGRSQSVYPIKVQMDTPDRSRLTSMDTATRAPTIAPVRPTPAPPVPPARPAASTIAPTPRPPAASTIAPTPRPPAPTPSKPVTRSLDPLTEDPREKLKEPVVRKVDRRQRIAEEKVMIKNRKRYDRLMDQAATRVRKYTLCKICLAIAVMALVAIAFELPSKDLTQTVHPGPMFEPMVLFKAHAPSQEWVEAKEHEIAKFWWSSLVVPVCSMPSLPQIEVIVDSCGRLTALTGPPETLPHSLQNVDRHVVADREFFWLSVLSAKILALPFCALVLQMLRYILKPVCFADGGSSEMWRIKRLRLLYHLINNLFLYLLVDMCLAYGYLNDQSGLPWEMWNQWMNWIFVATLATALFRGSSLFWTCPGLGSGVLLIKDWLFFGMCLASHRQSTGRSSVLALAIGVMSAILTFFPFGIIVPEDTPLIASHWPVVVRRGCCGVRAVSTFILDWMADQATAQTVYPTHVVALWNEFPLVLLEVAYGYHFGFTRAIKIIMLISLVKIVLFPLPAKLFKSFIIRKRSVPYCKAFAKASIGISKWMLENGNLVNVIPELVAMRLEYKQNDIGLMTPLKSPTPLSLPEILKAELPNMPCLTFVRALRVLRQVGFTAKQIYEIEGINEERPFRDFLRAGYKLSELQSSGFNLVMLKQLGCTAADLRKADDATNGVKLTASRLKVLGYAGYVELYEAGCTIGELFEAGFTYEEAKAAYGAKLKLQKVLDLSKGNKVAAETLKKQGCSAKELRLAKYTWQELHNAGYNLAQLEDAGCRLKDLHLEGFSLKGKSEP